MDAICTTAYPPSVPDNRTFEQKLEDLINYHCMENDSNTPDFILASYVADCLQTWNRHTRARDTWYGVKLEPGNAYFPDREGYVPLDKLKSASDEEVLRMRVVPRG